MSLPAPRTPPTLLMAPFQPLGPLAPARARLWDTISSPAQPHVSQTRYPCPGPSLSPQPCPPTPGPGLTPGPLTGLHPDPDPQLLTPANPPTVNAVFLYATFWKCIMWSTCKEHHVGTWEPRTTSKTETIWFLSFLFPPWVKKKWQ